MKQLPEQSNRPNNTAELYDHGDPIARYVRWKGGLTRTAVKAGAVGVGTFMPVLHGISNYTIGRLIEGGVVYSAPVALLMGVESVVSAHRNRTRYKKSLEEATALEASVGEPVDIVRAAGRRSKEPALAMRWYGLDGAANKPPARVAARLEALAVKADELGVKQVAVGTSWLEGSQLSGKDELEKYGSVISGPTALQTLVQPERKRPQGARASKRREFLIDHKADPEVLVASPKELMRLMRDHEAEHATSAIQQIVKDLGNNRLSELYELTEKHVPQADSQLRRAVRLALERKLDEGSATHAVKDASGIVTRHRAAVSITVDGGKMHRKLDYYNAQSGQRGLVNGDSDDLLKLAGVDSLDELLEVIAAPKNAHNATRERLIALHLLLEQGDTTTTTLSSAGPGAANQVDSLFSRLKAANDAKKPRRSDRKKQGVERDHEISSVYSPWVRITAAVGGLAAGVTMFGGAGYTGMQIWNASYNYNQKNAESFLKTLPVGERYYSINKDSPHYEAYLEFLRQQGGEAVMHKHISEFFNDMSNLDYEVSSQLIKFFAEQLDIEQLRSLSRYTDYVDAKWIEKLKANHPTNIDKFDINVYGDIPNGKENDTLYTVTSPTGKSTKGYWYGEVNDRTHFEDASLPPFKGKVPVMSEYANHYPIQISADDGAINALGPDFVVETPRFGLNAGYSAAHLDGAVIPVKDGTQLMGAYLFDKDNPDLKSGPLPILQDEDGTYRINGSYDEGLLNFNGKRMQNPQLRYFLKEKADKAGPTFIYQSPFRVDHSSHNPEFTEDDLVNVASKVRRALGLSDKATANQVYAAIEAKKYSYTPFKTSGVGTIDLRDMTDQAALETVGTVLARMEALNCGVAQALTLYATLDKDVWLNPASGFRDNGDGKLTTNERHAWLIKDNDKILDTTPGTFADGEQDMSKPTDQDAKQAQPSNRQHPIGEVLLLTAIMAAGYVGYNRRQQLGAVSDAVRSAIAMKGPRAADARGVVEQVLYDDSKIPLEPVPTSAVAAASPAKALARHLSSAPRGGVSLREVRERLKPGQKLSPSLTLALQALHANDAAMRRHLSRQGRK